MSWFLIQAQPGRAGTSGTWLPRRPLYQPLPVLQVLPDVLPVCEPGLCCADAPEDPQLAASVQVLSLVSASWAPEPGPLTQELLGKPGAPFWMESEFSGQQLLLVRDWGSGPGALLVSP